jgi:hypothetical protein
VGDIVDIKELARLFLAQQGVYGTATVETCTKFQLEFHRYLTQQPSLIEMYPDITYREQKLHVRVRAFARRLLLEQEARASGTVPADEPVLKTWPPKPLPVGEGWGTTQDYPPG